MERWREVWRRGFAPVLPTEGLEALLVALEADSPELIQGSTTTPPPLLCVRDWPVEGACALGYCGWRGAGLATVEEVEEFFGRVYTEAGERLGEVWRAAPFLEFYDDTPRDEMRRELAAEVRLTLAERGAVA